MSDRIELRPAVERDARILFEWRNDPLTRANSRNSEQVPWGHHVAWFRSTLTNPDRHLLIAEIAGTAVGTVRFDRTHSEGHEVSYTTAPQFRGKGLMKRILLQACGGVSGPVIAEIKRDNLPSISVARACGFVRGEVAGDMEIWRRL